MLDPITALGLTASVVQLVESGFSFVSKCKEFYRSGSSLENTDLTILTNDIQNVNIGLIESLEVATREHRPPPSAKREDLGEKTDQALLTLARKCQVVSSQLSQKLRRLNDDCKTKKWKSIRQAFKNVWAREDVDALANRLRQYRDELQFHLIVSVRKRLDHIHVDEEQRFRQLNAEGQDIIRKLMDKKCDVFETNLHSQTEKLWNRHGLSDHLTGQGFQEQTRQHQSAENNAQARYDDIKQLLRQHEILADQRQEEILAAINEKRSKLISRSTEQAVLDHLRFERMSDRQDEVAEQYQQTFEWVFAGVQEGQQKWPKLEKWLEAGDGCYWLHGKPGSGKSTLMKFVADDKRTFNALKRWAPRTRSLLSLESWAPDNGIITASFYFWRAGSYMQKSQAGLLQTLLYELLCQCPAIIPVVFPQLYENESKSASERTIPLHSLTLTLGQLKKAFKRLVDCSGSQFGICLFVDGLDEYIADQGTHDELARFFIDLCGSSKMKAVLSSRPLAAFQDVLGYCPNLRLQDLTVGDINFYVTDRINKHKRVIYLKDDDPWAVEELINEIKAKAEGVFLWVKLAVNTLLDGLQSYDSIDDLKSRLQELPGEVDELYMCMLERISPRYQFEASKLLQLVTCFRSFGMVSLTTLAMSFAMEKDPTKAINARVQEISEDEVINRAMILQGRLAAICSGFFEIHRRPVTEKVTRAPGSRQAWLELAKHTRRKNHEPEILQIGEFESWKTAEVEFLHRTAADFLGQDHIEKYLTQITSKENFDPVKSLLRSCVFRVKVFPCEYVTSLPSGEMGEVILEAFLYALDNEKQTGRVQVILLNEIDKSLAQHRRRLKHWDVMHDKNTAHCRRAEAHASFEHYEPFIGMAARYGLHRYFNFKISREGLSECENDARPLLFSVLRVPRRESKKSSVPIMEQPPSLRLVKLLLDAGADPNAPWHGLTAWTYACINYFEMSVAYQEESDMNQYTDIMAAMILAGADPNVLIEKRGIKLGPFGGVVMSPMSSIKLPRGTYVRAAEGPRELGNRLIELLERRGGREHHMWIMPEKSFWVDHVQKRHMQNFEGLNSAWVEWRLFADAKRQKTTFKNVRTVWYRKNETPCVIASDWDFGVCDEAAPQPLWEGVFVP